MFKDQMTPVERQQALARGEAVDRLPVGIIYSAPVHNLMGWTIPQEWESGRSLAEVQKKLYYTFHVDGLGAGHGLHGLGLLYGAGADIYDHAPLSLHSYPLQQAGDYRQLDLEQTAKDSRAAKCMECLQILREEMGKEVGCGMSFAAPFTAASGLVGPEKLLRGLIRDPENVHGLLAFAEQALLRLAEPFIREGFSISISDPMASGSILSPARYREFVQPYNLAFIAGCKEKGADAVSTHICGDTTILLEEIANCGFNSFSMDNAVDLAEAKRRIGDKIALVGNVPPTDIMYMGTPDQVRAAVRECFRKACDSPQGFTISTGCDCPYGTPDANVIAYLDEAKYCASLPQQPENFSS